MTDNYLVTRTRRDRPPRFIFFDTADRASRAAAWDAIQLLQPRSEAIAVWHSPDSGRYIGEEAGEPHAVVGPSFAPISGLVRVVGVGFNTFRKWGAPALVSSPPTASGGSNAVG